MLPISNKYAAQYLTNPVNHTINGTFNDSEASFTWAGSYWGGFRSIGYSYPVATIANNPKGTYNITFQGKIDSARSDPLSPRASAPPGYNNTINDPSWTETIERTEPRTTTFYSSATKFQLQKGLGLWFWAGFPLGVSWLLFGYHDWFDFTLSTTTSPLWWKELDKTSKSTSPTWPLQAHMMRACVGPPKRHVHLIPNCTSQIFRSWATPFKLLAKPVKR